MTLRQAQDARESPPRAMQAGDSEFRLWAGKLKLTVDGVDITKLCCGYDLDQQTAVVHVRGRDGRLLFDEARDRVLRAVISGDVKVTAK